MTLVMTACFSLSCATASATRRGSSGSTASGLPWLTAQKRQLRVQVLPRIINVAVRARQHSPMFGQCALWQTVWRFADSTSRFSSRYSAPSGALALNPTRTTH